MNNSFEQWIRDCAPENEIDDIRKEAHLVVLKERLRQREIRYQSRQKRQLRASMVAVVAVFIIVSGNFSQLGSDGFDLIEFEGVHTKGKIVKNVFRGDGFNVLEGESSADILETNRQITAGEGVVFKLEGWTISKKTHWIVCRLIVVNGKEKILAQSPDSIPEENTKQHFLYLTQDWEAQLKKMESDGPPPGGELKKVVDGVTFQLQYWDFDTKDFGPIRYYMGTPIR